MDTSTPNPAVDKQFVVAPVLLEAVAKEPELAQELARKMLLVNMVKLDQALKLPNVPLAQRIAGVEQFAKLSGVYTKANAVQATAGAGGPTLIINFPQIGSAPATVIEMKAPAAASLPKAEPAEVTDVPSNKEGTE